MDLRPYQSKAVGSTLAAWESFDRLLGVAATGAGKTVIASHILLQRFPHGPSLFIAHRKELLTQAIDKLTRVTHVPIGLEQAEKHSNAGHRIVVASVDSLHETRLLKWTPEHFGSIIIDECHRSVSQTYRRVLNYFYRAKTLGITATPDRTDQRSLGEIFEHIAFEIGLIPLVRDGWLAPIRTEQIPLKIDLGGVGLDSRGDLDANQTAERLEPYLDALALELANNHIKRKTLVFLPLVKLSQSFAEAAQAVGLAAEHIDGESKDREEILARFREGETRVLSCAALLSEGYDEPSIDCVVMMRPTQSRSFYYQCVGRGFRTCEGKTDLLVLDPFWLSSEHSLVKPASLVAETDAEAEQIAALLEEEPDLLRAMDQAKAINLALVQQKARELAKVLDATSKRERTVFDPLEIAGVLGNEKLADFIPVMHWHTESVTTKQAELLVKLGVNPDGVMNRGHAHVILKDLLKRTKKNLATFRQLRYLIKYHHPSPHMATVKEASEFLDKIWRKGRRGQQLSLV
jgi:superfamily II DNA or RNA helicase